MTKQNILGLLLVGLLITAIGCGPPGRGLRVEFVEGTVTLDGQPLDGVLITFIPVNEGDGTESALGRSNERGVYRLSSMNGDPERGAVAGEYRITASKVFVDDPMEGMSTQEAAASGLEVTHTEVLPAIYRDRKNTPLSATVNKGRNKIDLELTSNP